MSELPLNGIAYVIRSPWVRTKAHFQPDPEVHRGNNERQKKGFSL